MDALASNAGDRYHFVYAARRMLDMLHPQSNLEKIVMESVTKEDLLLEDREETFLGVDLTEYYGGQDSNDADNIVVVQVKYSPTNPDGKWTLNRLCANKPGKSGSLKPGTSILRKLSNVFIFFYRKLGNNTAEKLQIKLHSNQPLDDKLKNHLLEIREMVVKKNNSEGVKHLKSASGEIREIIKRIKEIADLSWIRLSMFLKCLDINEFGQAMLSVVESELFNKSSSFRSDNHVYVDGLISFVQEHAVTNHPTEITKKSVYALLRLREIDFFPAPTDFPELENPIFTKTAAHVIKKIESMDSGILIVHGISGTGKSTLVQLISQKYGGGKSTVVYDCFAGGAGLKVGNERFPYTKCFVQIINDLDALIHTNILATTQLRYEHLMRQFTKALSEASQIALKSGNRLVVAIDAVDNAVEAASRAPIKIAESFVPIIWQLEFPENCIFVVTARTENIATLKIKGEYESFEIEGFTLKETGDYIRSSWKDADDDLIKHIFKRTKGNPRVQSKILEDAKRNHPEKLIDFISEKAKESVFEYYKTECPKRVNSADELLLLAVLFETAPSISIQTLSKIMRRSVEKMRSIIESLYFGLRITGNNEINWIDQDFFDFTKEYTANQKAQSCSILAEYCRNNYGRCNFATSNISHCFYNAGWYKELLHWWISENHLTSRIEEVSPHEEDVLRDVRYTLLAAQKIEKFADALKLLGLSADILQGRDVFSSVLKDQPVIAIRCNYLDRLLDYLEGKEKDYELASYYISIGRALSESNKQKERAKELIHRGFTIIIQENQKYPRGGRGYTIKNIRDIALYNANTHSLEIALKKMQIWTPQENVYPVFAMVTRIWTTQDCEETIKKIKMNELNDYQSAYSLLGVISSKKVQLSKKILYGVAQTVLKSIKDNIIDCNKINDMVPGIVENLLSQKLIEIAKLFIPYWEEPKISGCIDFKRKIPEFLRKKAVETILNIEKFKPDEFK